MRTIGNTMASALPAAVMLALLALLPSFGCKNRLMFHPYPVFETDPSAAGLAYKDAYFRAADGIVLHGWWIPATGALGTVLFCHGNAGNISFLVDTMSIFHGMGLNVFVFDYRGFGRSGGEPTEEGTYRDAEAAWSYLVKVMEVPESRVVVVGRSLGGPIAAWLVRDRAPAGLVLESTFTRAADVADAHYGFPAGLIMGDAYDTTAYLSRARCPVMVVHSPEDEIVPYSLGKRLFDAAAGPREFLVIHGSHNGGFISSLETYRTGLSRFMHACLR